jgi:arylsulfatase A
MRYSKGELGILIHQELTMFAIIRAAMSVALLIGAIHQADAVERPNIVLILCDDLGYGDVQCLNPQLGKIATPNMNMVAQQGMSFTDAHSGSSVCTPTRYGLLTGRYAWRTRLQHGVLDNYDPPLIDENRLTLGKLLQQNGYHTSCVGKWHLGFSVDQPPPKKAAKGAGSAAKGTHAGAPLGAITRDGPNTRGFDLFFGFHHARMMQSTFEGDRVTEMIDPIDMLPRLANRAVEIIETRTKAGGPFFLYLPLSSPHTPIVPAKEWQGKSGLGAYADFVMQTDAVVGQVLEALQKNNQTENTLVVLTSDNGCTPSVTDSLQQAGHFPSGEFRGYKSDIWEGGHRIPLLVRWPQRIAPGTVSKSLVCLSDVMATCAHLIGAKIPANEAEDSFSFLPELLQSGATDRTSIVHHSIQGMFAIRQENMKLCLGAGSGGWTKGGTTGGMVQLYDLTADVGERRNLAAERPETVQLLKSTLRNIINNGRSTPGEPLANDIAIHSGWEQY